MLLYPVTYYFVFSHARYRHPIEPEMAILIVFVLTEAIRSQKEEVRMQK